MVRNIYIPTKINSNKKVEKMPKVKAVSYGVGAVGSLIAKYLLRKEGIEIVGAIDVAKKKVGKDLGEVLGTGKHLGMFVSRRTEELLSKTKPDIVIHATSSYLKDVYPQLLEIMKYGANIISTCEELSYPYFSEPELAKKLDECAKENNVTVLGTGINPGFLMDTLVIALTAVCQKISKIKVLRIMNAATRRVPFQKKIGAGLSLETFRNAIDQKLITGHVGLEQSIAMIAAALAWNLERIEVDPVAPIVAKEPVRSESIKVRAGFVAGLKQRSRGFRRGKEVISLDFQAYVGADEEYDSIMIDGVPPISQRISPCVHGDIGTTAVVANAIPKVINAKPGLVTMKDLPIFSATTESMEKYL